MTAGLAFGAVRLLSGDADADSSASPTGASGSTPAAGERAPDGSARADAGTDGTGSDDAADASASESAAEQSPKAQATAVDDLLGESTDDRQKVIDAVNAVSSCRSPQAVASAKADLTAAAERRDDLVDRLSDLDVGAVEGGPAAASELKSAWQHSADADRAFADWAANVSAGGCTPGNAPRDGDYHHAVASSGKASTAKEAFVDKWDPIAAEHGLRSRSANAI